MSHDGLPAYQVTFGPTPVNLYVWRDGDSDSQFADDTPHSGKFAH